MSRQYTHLKQYEEEIMQMKANGYSRRQIAEKIGITSEQVHDYVKRYNRKQREIESGILPKKKGRPCKSSSLETEIARLKMENELLRDFLSLTERK